MPRLAPEPTVDDNPDSEPWTPPVWILSTDPRHAARVAAVGSRSQAHPMFRLKASQIEAKTYQAIRSRIAGTASREKEPEFRQTYHRKILEGQRKVAELQQTIDELLERKKESIEDIQVVRRQEMEKEIKMLEQKMRKEHHDKIKERKREWETKLEAEFEERRKRLREEHENRRRERIEARESAKPNEVVEIKEVNEETEQLKKEVADMKAEIDEMNERKSEMIWLLKQVIKAEEKQKAQTQGERKS